jgi:hypothetical protein
MGTSANSESMAPVSKKITLSGALMCLAAMAASIAIPVPQKTIGHHFASRIVHILLLTVCPTRLHTPFADRP